ncbi:MAG: aminopeptidase P family N-terminal domain-containing protein [Candidatus Eisenbacteria bacterium]|nr:aminopeptidase P family N-terminal domain-containing protein [Candidatus Eisenbacteria bacterium]
MLAAAPWLSGFTGSAGELLVSADSAGVWTDGRYFIQADAEPAAPASGSSSRANWACRPRTSTWPRA